MPYTTTHLQPTKSYPTYQLYVTASGNSLTPEDVLKICILETLRWLRSRLVNFPDLPEEIRTPEPSDYARFTLDALHSFRLEAGGSIDVIWSEKRKIWSFCMTEADMGANPGTDRERPPVIGRSFRTEMSYCLRSDDVEVGIRTICSDPLDCEVLCEVFRPTVVKALAEHPKLTLRHQGLNLDGQVIRLDRRDVLDRVTDAVMQAAFDLPVVYVAQPAAEAPQQKLPAMMGLPAGLDVTKGFTPQASLKGFTLNLEKTDVKSALPKEKPSAKPRSEPGLAVSPKAEQPALPEFPCDALARSMLGFAVVVFVPDKQREALNRKTGMELQGGEILIQHGRETERYPQKRYARHPDEFYQRIRSQLYLSPKRRSYHFGEVVFHAQAQLLELHNRRHETEDLAETCRIYHMELEALRGQVKQLYQEKADMQQAWESLRITQKKLLLAQEDAAQQEAQLIALQTMQKEREEAYQRSAHIIEFYKQKAEIAAHYPDTKEHVCDWAAQLFAGELIVTNDARSSLRKYAGKLDLAMLCDAFLFLDAYAGYRRGEIPPDELALYAERYSWEVQGCGKETLQMRRSDYLTVYEGTQYLLDQHIKYGVSAQVLLRIYFCWEETLQRLIIGHLPGHLPTVKKGT